MDESADAAATPSYADPNSIGSLCHQLRQPLVVAVGYVSMLEDGSFGELPGEAAAILRTVAERLDAMNVLIDRIASSRSEPEEEANGA